MWFRAGATRLWQCEGRGDDALIDRLPRTPLQRVLRRAPLGFDSDVWVRPEHLDPDRHFVIHRRPDGTPWTDSDLDEFVADHVTRRLDLEQPPFLVHLLEPVEGGRLALYVKIHHCVTDGVGFQTILGLLSDEPPTEVLVPPLDSEADLPSRHDWLRGSVAGFRETRRRRQRVRSRGPPPPGGSTPLSRCRSPA
ncbi:MAG: hypothetical protein F2681_02015 [Actinobacteria bacterium]|uniref:Unannotated protein n=1 Tax=freshwater metagenome TaxID=449393 RepID=A0A6J6Q785_9ZZZZ|nr:hypothetical protein [Actinomycetota bacterium]MSW76190.1 hypothetical protein [Actinomycetota bacterium]MSX55004.1 hypothetical protein [Actinomycetota bacterium]MSZ81900.1 hypothetical protein [Actinomycetota bacterium]MTB16739.1 hypothetical protein [Actinomycetota bacterium]